MSERKSRREELMDELVDLQRVSMRKLRELKSIE